jgi:hypothetical protein
MFQMHRGSKAVPVVSSLTVVLSFSLLLLSGCNTQQPTQEPASENAPPSATSELEPPKGLVASADTAEEVVLRWQQPPAGTTHYTIERKSGENTDFAPIAAYVPATVLEYKDKVSPDTEYVYQIRPHQATVTGQAVAGPVTVRTPPLEPLAPERLDAKASGPDQVNLSWGEAPNATRFSILRSDKADGEYAMVDTVDEKQVFVDKDLAPGTEYWYVVRAMNNGKAFAETAPVSVRTEGKAEAAPAQSQRPPRAPETEGPPPPPVSPPRHVEAQAVSPQAAVLRWSATPNVNTFTILRADERSGYYRMIDTIRGRLDYTDSGLMPDTEYFYKIRAHGPGGWLADSRPVVVRMPIPPPPPIIVIPPPPPRPEAPGRVEIGSVSPYEIELRWRESANAHRYAIMRSESRHGRFTPVDTVHDRTRYHDRDVAPNTQYWYKIRAFNSSWVAADSDIVSAHTDPVPAGVVPPPMPVRPEAPKSVKAKAVSPTQINLAWTEAANAQSFLVLRSDKSDGEYFPLEKIENKWSYSDSGLEPDTEYWYKIRAVSAASGTAETKPISARTQAAPKPTPGPSPSPSPTATPTPTPQPSPTPTPALTPTPTPEPSPTPTPAPSPTPTKPPKPPKPTPGQTVAPVSTVKPTPEPVATVEPGPAKWPPVIPVRTVRPIGTMKPLQTVKPVGTIAPKVEEKTNVEEKPTLDEKKNTPLPAVTPRPTVRVQSTVKPQMVVTPASAAKVTTKTVETQKPAETKEGAAGSESDASRSVRRPRVERREALRNAITDETTTGTSTLRRDSRALRERVRERN